MTRHENYLCASTAKPNRLARRLNLSEQQKRILLPLESWRKGGGAEQIILFLCHRPGLVDAEQIEHGEFRKQYNKETTTTAGTEAASGTGTAFPNEGRYHNLGNSDGGGSGGYDERGSSANLRGGGGGRQQHRGDGRSGDPQAGVFRYVFGLCCE